MSRSYKKTLKGGNTTSRSEKKDKCSANQKLRSLQKQKIKEVFINGDVILPTLKEVSNVWNFDKDGKSDYTSWYNKLPDNEKYKVKGK